jgi:pimeloyl-ACP methyl ester carboxylesterase
MMSPRRMARRVRLLAGLSLERELGPLNVRTLIVTGEPDLDRVVPVRLTCDYLRLWPHAAVATLPRTGHIGCVTRADEFARVVTSFVQAGANVESGVQTGLEDAAPEPRRGHGLHLRKRLV